jgi:hypothetical protein
MLRSVDLLPVDINPMFEAHCPTDGLYNGYGAHFHADVRNRTALTPVSSLCEAIAGRSLPATNEEVQ